MEVKKNNPPYAYGLGSIKPLGVNSGSSGPKPIIQPLSSPSTLTDEVILEGKKIKIKEGDT